ncbi:MAG: Lrp/AsnC family transcriptional regulator [Chloroflexi bacterium]|nr:Lrp/AsnC family transcriptional regulator [Chloroflexota bacterium]
MLQRLLELVAEGGLRSYADLARELGVSEGLVGQMIEDLARRGYLRPVAGDCETQCSGCSLAGTCAVGGPTRVWMLTEK